MTFCNNLRLLLQVTEFPFFATKVRVGRNGVEEIFPLGPLNSYERWARLCLMQIIVACNLRASCQGCNSKDLWFCLIFFAGKDWKRWKQSYMEALRKGLISYTSPNPLNILCTHIWNGKLIDGSWSLLVWVFIQGSLSNSSASLQNPTHLQDAMGGWYITPW